MRYLLLLFASIALAGCSVGSDTIVNGSSLRPTFLPPAVGSKFAFKDWYTDSDGNNRMLRGAWTYTVLESGINYRGKRNVARFQDDSDTAPWDYVSYELNGNISVYRGLWSELPVVTHETRSDLWFDSSGGDVRKQLATFSYGGEEYITLANNRFRTVKIIQKDTSWFNGRITSAPAPATFWYAPETGWYIKVVSPSYDSTKGVNDLFELQSYDMK